jgi:hypothetical protein
MKSLLIASAIAAASFAAVAQQGGCGNLPFKADTTVGESKSRAEVLAELREAQAMGSIAYGNVPLPHDTERTFTSTRAKVERKVAELAADGKLYRNNNATVSVRQVRVLRGNPSTCSTSLFASRPSTAYGSQAYSTRWECCSLVKTDLGRQQVLEPQLRPKVIREQSQRLSTIQPPGVADRRLIQQKPMDASASTSIAPCVHGGAR